MPIRVGVIGAGVMGADHIRNLSTTVSGAEVTFVADLDAGPAAAAAPPSARITTDPSELIDSSEVDAVVVASDDSTHAGLVRRFDPGYVALRESTQTRTQDEPLQVHCTSRTASAGPGASSESAITNSAIHELDIIPWLLDAERRSSIPADWRACFTDAYRLQLQAWISALEKGEPAPLATGEDGLRASQLTQAMIRSLHSDGAYTKVVY